MQVLIVLLLSVAVIWINDPRIFGRLFYVALTLIVLFLVLAAINCVNYPWTAITWMMAHWKPWKRLSPTAGFPTMGAMAKLNTAKDRDDEGFLEALEKMLENWGL